MFLLLLFGEVQRQAQRLWEDVRLAGVLRQQGEVDQLLLPVNADDGNRKSLRLKIAAARQPGRFLLPQPKRAAEKGAGGETRRRPRLPQPGSEDAKAFCT